MSSIIHIDLPDKTEKIINTTMQSIDDFATFGIGSGTFDVAKAAADSVEAKTKAMVDGMISMVEATMQNLVDKGVDNLYASLGLNEETINVARDIIKMANNGMNLLSSGIMKGIVAINNFDIPAVPMSAVVAGLQVMTSICDFFYAKYIEKYQELIDMVITFVIDPGAVLEILKNVALQICNTIYDFIDEQFFMYTGYHLIEVYRLCAKGINMIKTLREARKKKNKKKEDKKDNEDKDSKVDNKTGYEVDMDVDITVDTELLEYNFKEWLQKQNDALYNSFLVTQVLDAINSIKEVYTTLTDVSLESLADNINSLDDLIVLLDDLGLGDDSLSVDLSMIPSLNINAILSSLNTLENTALTLANDAMLTSAAAIRSGVKIDGGIALDKTYSLTTDHKTATITLKIFTDPTESSLSKKIYKIFTNAKDENKKKLFDLAECKMIQDRIKTLWKTKTEKTVNEKLTVGKYTIDITIDVSDNNGARKMSLGNPDVNKDKEDEEDDNENNKNKSSDRKIPEVELGIIKEEYLTENQMINKTTRQRRNTIALLHMCYSMLKNIFPTLKKIAVLIQNYKINKAYVASKAYDNLLACFIEAMEKLGLTKKVKTDEPDADGRMTEVYTVRTYALYRFVQEKYHLFDNNTTTANINDEQVRTINEWLDKNDKESKQIPIDKNIMLMVDMYAISQEMNCLKEQRVKLATITDSELINDFLLSCNKYSNGTFNDMTNIEILDNMILYSDKNLPRMPSQIMMAQMRGCQPD